MPIHIIAAGILGALMLVVGHFWLVIVAFRTTIVWGLVTLFLPVGGSLVYIVMHWQRSVKPLFVYVGGLACIGCSIVFTMALPPEQLEALSRSSDREQSVTDEISAPRQKSGTSKKSPSSSSSLTK